MKAEAQAGGLLARILAETERRVAALAPYRSALERRAARTRRPADFAAALRGEAVTVIAEVKRRSPSAGMIRAGLNPRALANSYAEGGAAAISVVTEEAHFGGRLSDLAEVAGAVGLPVLRKDFVIDPLQLYEARAAGAAAVLLIVRALTAERLHELAAAARRVGLATLVEVHEAAELDLAVSCTPDAIGVNARDLDTLIVNVDDALRLLPRVPPGVPAVAESGLRSRADVARMASSGADAVLVGAAIAAAASPDEAVRELTGVPRAARRPA